MSRTLRLRREPLAALTSDDLAAVAGGMPITHVCNTFDSCSFTPVPDLPTVGIRCGQTA